MRGAVADHLLAGAAVHQQCDLVAHGAGREEDPRLLAQHRSHARLQRVDGGVLAALLVADLGLGQAWRMAAVGRVTVSLLRST